VGLHAGFGPLPRACSCPSQVLMDAHSVRALRGGAQARQDLLSDLVWSDPCAKVSGWVPNPRGAGTRFGMDALR
jgi:hypothetical protein